MSPEPMTPGQRVRLARENLCMAMALFAASHRGLITAAFLPPDAEVYLPDGSVVDAAAPLHLPDHGALLRCAGNQIRGAFALSALQTQRELTTAYSVEPPDDPDANLRAARVAIHLIARSLERDLLAPAWNVPTEYRQVFSASDFGFTLDGRQLHGREIRWEHFGGLPRYLDVTRFISHCLDGVETALAARMAVGDYGAMGELAATDSSAAFSPGPVDASIGYGSGSGRPRRNATGSARPRPVAGWIAPNGPPQPRFSVAAQASECGPVADFVACACSTGDQAMTLAGDLYTSYARWCLDHGYLAHSQRKFGLELRAHGYQRKRRGKGRHWWLGLRLVTQL